MSSTRAMKHITTVAAAHADQVETLSLVLGVKAAATDAALASTESAMRVCDGAAFSKHLPIERAFRTHGPVR